MTKRPNISETNLRDFYLGQKLSTYKIADIYHCHPAQIRTLLNILGIPRRSRREAMLLDRGIIIDKQELIKLYLDKDCSVYEIANLYKCDASTICRKLKENNIATKSPREQVKLSKKQLISLYRTRKLSTYKIAGIIGCTVKTVVKKMNKFGIKRRKNKKVPIDKKRLLELYLARKYSLRKIGEIYRITPSAVFRKFQKNSIKLRNSWETNIKYKRSRFSGSKEEKAYLIGFRLGDLGISQPSKRTRAIRVSSSTTKQEQVKLINDLFKKYSHLWITQPGHNGAVNVSTILHPSFRFLLPKEDRIRKWILRKKNLMRSFISGYVDAEGNLGVYSNRARFRVGSYDIGILTQIDLWFKKQGIKSILRLESKKKIGQNKDFWRLTVNEAKSLLILHDNISKSLRHEKRALDFNKVYRNIKLRLNNGTIHV